MNNFMPGEWGGVGNTLPNLGGLFGGGGIPGLGSLGGFGADFLGSQLGIQPNMLGSIGGLLGNFSPLGPLGGALGGLAGNALGGLFGMGPKLPPRPRVNYVYDFATGNPTLKGGKVYDQQGMDVFGQLTDYIGDTSKDILGTLGLTPGMDKFGFGAFQGRTGFTLGTDPFVRDRNSPGAFNAIGPSSPGQRQAQQMGRVFGSLGERTAAPSPELIQQASQAALDALILPAIQGAGLTNADIFGKFGLPTTQADFTSFLQSVDPNFSFGSALDFAAPSQFTVGDLMAAQQLGGLRSRLPGMTTPQPQPQAGTSMSDTDFFRQAFGFNPFQGTDTSDLAAQLRALLGGMS